MAATQSVPCGSEKASNEQRNRRRESFEYQKVAVRARRWGKRGDQRGVPVEDTKSEGAELGNRARGPTKRRKKKAKVSKGEECKG